MNVEPPTPNAPRPRSNPRTWLSALRFSGKINWLSLRARLTVGFLAVIGLMILVGAMSLLMQQRMVTAMRDLLDVDVQIADLSNESRAAILAARRCEKDFLLRQGELGFDEARFRYVTLLKVEVANIRRNDAAIRQLTTDPHVAEQTKAVEWGIGLYEAGFLTVVDLYKQRGSFDSGLEGAFRLNIQEIESMVTETGQLHLRSDVLSVRQSEKNYLLRRREMDAQQTRQAVNRTRTDLAQAALASASQETFTRLIDQYLTSFNQCVQTDGQIASATEAYRTTVHKVEPLLEQLHDWAKEKALATQAGVERLAAATRWIVITVFLIAVLIGLLVAMVVSRSIQNGVTTCIAFAGRVTKGDLSTRLSQAGHDEFGVLAASLNSMAQQLDGNKASLLAEIVERRRTEEERDRYFTLSLDLLCTGDFEGNIHRINPAYQTVLGYSPADLVGRNYLEMVHPEDQARVIDQLKNLAGGTSALDFENRNRCKDGSYRRIVWRVVPDVANGLIYVSGQDVTERRKAEEALRASEERFALALQGATDGLWDWNLVTDEVYYSPRWKGILGYEDHEVLSDFKAFEALLFPEDRERVLRAICDHVEGEGHTDRYEVEFCMHHKQGHWVDILSRGHLARNAAGKPVRMIGTHMDLTERKRAEEKLRASEERFRQLAENIGEVFWIASADNQKMIYVSPAFEEIWGRTAESLYQNGFQWAEAIVKEDQPRIFEAARRFAEDQGQFDQEYRISRPDGSVRWIHARGSQVRDAEGKVQYTVGVASDITERKTAAASLEEMHKKLVESSREAGMAVVATSVLHNVGNVLNSVNVSAELIAEKVKRLRPASLAKVESLLREHAHDLPDFLAHDPRGKELPAYLSALFEQLADPHKDILPEVALLRKNVDHIREIIRMQQTYARGAGVMETIPLTDLVEDAIRINAAALTHHQVRLIREYSPVPPFAMERHKVLQILVNVLNNAKHALQACSGGDRKLTIRVVPNGNNAVKISVMDNGVGIPAENLTRVFQHGFTTRQDGHGFGLHSGALAAQEMGGSLTAYSEGLGKGALFTLELPCQTTVKI